MAAHAPDALDPLVLATVGWKVGQRIVGESHALPAVVHHPMCVDQLRFFETTENEPIRGSRASGDRSSLCESFRRASGTRSDFPLSPALEAPGYYQTSLRGENSIVPCAVFPTNQFSR